MFFKKKVSAYEFGAWLSSHYAECGVFTTQRLMARYVRGTDSLPNISENHRGFSRESCYNFALGLATGCGVSTFESLNEKKIDIIKMEFLSRIDAYNDNLGASFDPLENCFQLEHIVKENKHFRKTGYIVKGGGEDPLGLSYQIVEYCMKRFMRGTPLFRDALEAGGWIAKTFSAEFSSSFNAGANVYKKIKIR